MSDVRRVAGNTIALFMGKGVRLLVSMVLGVLLARYLGDLHYGNWTVARSLCALLTILTALGMSKIAIRECSSRPEDTEHYLGTVLVLRLLFSLVSILIALLLVYGLGYHAEIAYLVFVALGIYILSSLGEVFVIQFRSHEKMGYEAIANISKDILLMLLVFLAMYLQWGVLRIAFLYLGATAAYLVLSWSLSAKKFSPPRLSLDPSLARHLILAGIPIGLAVFFNSFHDVTRVIINQIIGSSAAGNYSVAALPYLALESTVVISMMGAVFPLLSRLHLSDRLGLIGLYRRMSRYLFMLSLLVALYCLFLGDELILILYGNDYLNAIPVLKLLGLGVVLMFQNYLLFNAMVACGKEKMFALVMGLGAVINVLGVILFTGILSRLDQTIVIGGSTAGVGIRLIPVTGGPLALISAHIFIMVVLSIIIHREYGRGIILSRFINPVIAAGLTGGLIRWEGVIDIPIGVILVSGAVVYGLLLVALRSFDRTDRDIFKSILFAGQK
ncbi:MAG: flippase [Candidatus Auribacterota bacterium]|nr:flippase [Candidatus Auribacterota bacterium]